MVVNSQLKARESLERATFYGCERNEDDILAARSRLGSDTLLEHLLRAANIDTLILDPAYPLSSACYTPERMGQLGHCRSVKMLSPETLMHGLILDYSDLNEVTERYADQVKHGHEHGYCAL